MNQISNRQIFREAHAIARMTAGEAGSYMIAFKCALISIYDSLKRLAHNDADAVELSDADRRNLWEIGTEAAYTFSVDVEYSWRSANACINNLVHNIVIGLIEQSAALFDFTRRAQQTICQAVTEAYKILLASAKAHNKEGSFEQWARDCAFNPLKVRADSIMLLALHRLEEGR